MIENGHGENFVEGSFGIGADGDDDFFGGDVSSICIKPDQLNDNIANEWDVEDIRWCLYTLLIDFIHLLNLFSFLKNNF